MKNTYQHKSSQPNYYPVQFLLPPCCFIHLVWKTIPLHFNTVFYICELNTAGINQLFIDFLLQNTRLQLILPCFSDNCFQIVTSLKVPHLSPLPQLARYALFHNSPVLIARRVKFFKIGFRLIACHRRNTVGKLLGLCF